MSVKGPGLSRLCNERRILYSYSSVSTDPALASPIPVRSFWQRRIRDPLVAQLTQGITPHKIALTLAVGSAVAVFPVLGTSTLLCLLAAWALKLNQPITQLINQACWPVHVPVIYLCIRLGEKLFGATPMHFHIREMNHQFWAEPGRFFHEFGFTVLHAVTGWIVVAPFYITLVYALSLPVMRTIQRVKAEAAAKAAAARAPDHPIP